MREVVPARNHSASTTGTSAKQMLVRRRSASITGTGLRGWLSVVELSAIEDCTAISTRSSTEYTAEAPRDTPSTNRICMRRSARETCGDGEGRVVCTRLILPRP